MTKPTIDDGIFRTATTGLIGSRRVDIKKYLWQVEERAKRLRDAVKPRDKKQLKLKFYDQEKHNV